MPVLARMGNIGWDIEEGQLLDAARAHLLTAGVEPGDWTHPSAVVGRDRKGSAVDMMFKSLAKLTLASQAVKASNMTGMSGRRVYLEKKRSEQQNAEAKSVHRMFDAITELYDEKGWDTKVLSKSMGAMTISVQGSRFIARAAGKWHWTRKAKQSLTEAERAALEEEACIA